MHIKLVKGVKMKQNLGKKALAAIEKETDLTPVEMGEMLEKLTGKKLEKVIAEHQDFADEYFIQIIFQQENFHRKFMPNVHHLQAIVTRADPGMRPDRSCFKYNNKTQKLYHLWSLPDVSSCAFILENQTQLSVEEQPLLENVKQFYIQCIEAIKWKQKDHR